MPDQNHRNTSHNRQVHTFRRAQWAEVRAIEDILATLDAEGKLDGLPFMPEMLKYCGRKFRISRRADRIFLDRYFYVAKLNDAVFLESLRCDGLDHVGCQMRCELFWKEAWLKSAEPPPESGEQDNATEAFSTSRSSDHLGKLSAFTFTTRNENCFVCQATELVRASSRLHWWDPRQYVREVMLGETTVKALFVDLLARAKQKVLRKFQQQVIDESIAQPTPTESLNLLPGEWVYVKSLEEIHATLDRNGKNRGLGFAPDQAKFCGKRLRVAGRVEKIILEWSGEMRSIANTVELEEATCHGRTCRSCPRNCYHLWREIWLRRIPAK